MTSGEETEGYWLESLFGAHAKGIPIDSPAAGAGDLSLDAAYGVQRRLVLRLLKAGERVVGWKVGPQAARS